MIGNSLRTKNEKAKQGKDHVRTLEMNDSNGVPFLVSSILNTSSNHSANNCDDCSDQQSPQSDYSSYSDTTYTDYGSYGGYDCGGCD